jgi:hypothetical protein
VTLNSNFRIVMATVSIFLAIFGIAAAIHGLVFDEASAVKYGVAVLIGGIAAFVLLLNPASEFDDEAGQHNSPRVHQAAWQYLPAARSLAQDPIDKRMRIPRRERAAALRRRRHRRIAPVHSPAQTQLSGEHIRGMRFFSVPLGDLMKRRCEKGRIHRVAEHAMLTIDELGGLRLRDRGGSHSDQEQAAHLHRERPSLCLHGGTPKG